METKLTLSIESELAQTAKKYAKEQGYTLSYIVENYFLTLIKSKEITGMILTAPVANALLGSLKALDKADYKEEMVDSLTEKYL